MARKKEAGRRVAKQKATHCLWPQTTTCMKHHRAGSPVMMVPALRGYVLRNLCGVLGEFRDLLAMALRGGNHLHLLPGVRGFFAAIEAGNRGSRRSGGLGAARCATDCYGKAVAGVPAAKENVRQFFNHNPTFHT